jgi:hypothetical protein
MQFSVADPGYLPLISDPDFHPSLTPESSFDNKREGEKIGFLPVFLYPQMSQNFN